MLTLATFAGCVGDTPSGRPPTTAPPLPESFEFSAPIDLPPGPEGFGSEPSILATKDALYIVSVLGSATARGDGLWKSTDGGTTWSFLGKPDYPFGGGDADLDVDTAGTLYLPGQWRPYAVPGTYIAAESMAASKDGGKTWITSPVASDSAYTDRQWATTHGAGTVWLAFNQAQTGLVITKSIDSGLTWADAKVITPVGNLGPDGIPGDILADERDGRLYVPYGPGIGGGSQKHRLFISMDGGETFEEHVIHEAPADEQAGAIFGSLAMDSQGGLWYVWAESVGGRDFTRVFLATSTDRGATWSEPRPVSGANESAVFPWIAVGDPGRLAVAFYSANGSVMSDDAPAATDWWPKVALTQDGGVSFEAVVVSPTPNHQGPLCTGGTGCDPIYRQLGDFFEIGVDPQGHVVMVWVDDVMEPRVNRFARQTQGDLFD